MPSCHQCNSSTNTHDYDCIQNKHYLCISCNDKKLKQRTTGNTCCMICMVDAYQRLGTFICENFQKTECWYCNWPVYDIDSDPTIIDTIQQFYKRENCRDTFNSILKPLLNGKILFPHLFFDAANQVDRASCCVDCAQSLAKCKKCHNLFYHHNNKKKVFCDACFRANKKCQNPECSNESSCGGSGSLCRDCFDLFIEKVPIPIRLASSQDCVGGYEFNDSLSIIRKCSLLVCHSCKKVYVYLKPSESNDMVIYFDKCVACIGICLQCNQKRHEIDIFTGVCKICLFCRCEGPTDAWCIRTTDCLECGLGQLCTTCQIHRYVACQKCKKLMHTNVTGLCMKCMPKCCYCHNFYSGTGCPCRWIECFNCGYIYYKNENYLGNKPLCSLCRFQ